jgi:SOS-response transcriptional repressor LexA
METIGKRIRIARFEAGLDQKELAGQIGVPKEYISYWESDKRSPTIEHISIMSDILFKTPNYFFGLEDAVESLKITNGKSVSLRLAGEVSCGNLTYATSEDGEYLTEDMPINFFSKYGKLSPEEICGNYFILIAKGDSMSPYIEDRDTLVCKRVSDVDNGKIGVVVSSNSDATVKIISKKPSEIRLVPINKKYDEVVITPKDEEYRIVAEVVYVIRKASTFII